ncbi:MAG: FAD-dependent oxidoreductase [Planctomycetes bacterium]|nr:FAD-dependent oxidoreductase [Planctomycetota bacterium]MBI3847377.1 FAD-dependent oxidoreductase [Planctomycetota bacterium]
MTGNLLRERGYSVQLFESESKPGGLCRSSVVDGFVFDWAGGHILYTKDREVHDHVTRIIGADQIVESERQTKIFYRGNFVKYPFENGLADLPKSDNFDCLAGYIEAAFARRNGASAKPSNFKDWVLWRFGPGIAKHFMFPYNEKIWKADLASLSIDWVDGRVPDAPIEDVIRSSIGIPTEGYTHQARFRYPRRGGFGTLTDRLAETLGEDVRLSTPVLQVRRLGSEWEVNGERFDRVINTIPLQELYRRLEGADPTARAAAEGLQFRGLVSILIGVDGPEPTRHSWIYLPHPENGPANRITHLANYSPENAPPGKHSLLAEVTYEGDLRVDQRFVDDVVDGLHRSGLVDKKKVVTTAFHKSHYAYVLFTHGFQRNLDTATHWLDSIGLHTAGRFGRYEYLNSDQCMRRAIDLVDKHFPPVKSN